MANLWWPNSDCLTTWTTTRTHKILLFHLWMGQQTSVSSLLKKGLACQKIPGTRNHECGKSTTSGIELNFVTIHAFIAWSDKKFCKGHEPRRSLREKFPRLSEEKLKEGIFIGPQIGDLITDEYFDKLLQDEEKEIWDSFKFVVKGFSGNRRAQNYEDVVNNLLQNYQKLRCNMSLKIHFLHSHLDFSQRIVVQWMMNTENISIKTFLQWRRDIKGNGTGLCSPTTAGLWQGISLPWNTGDRQNEKNKK